MKGDKILEFFRNIVDDQPDSDLEIDLLNTSKDVVEGFRDWEILKKVNTSNSTSSGSTYLTAIALPSDFMTPRQIYVGDDGPYIGVPFEHRIKYKGRTRTFYIDYANNNLHLSGSHGSGKTISIFYTYKTTDWNVGNLTTLEPVWLSKYHKLIAFMMSEIHGGAIDVDQIQAAQNPFRDKHARLLWDAMISWDDRLKLNAMNYSSAPVNNDFAVDDPDIINESRW
mgnify:CR=1 FL=1